MVGSFSGKGCCYCQLEWREQDSLSCVGQFLWSGLLLLSAGVESSGESQLCWSLHWELSADPVVWSVDISSGSHFFYSGLLFLSAGVNR